MDLDFSALDRLDRATVSRPGSLKPTARAVPRVRPGAAAAGAQAAGAQAGAQAAGGAAAASAPSGRPPPPAAARGGSGGGGSPARAPDQQQQQRGAQAAPLAPSRLQAASGGHAQLAGGRAAPTSPERQGACAARPAGSPACAHVSRRWRISTAFGGPCEGSGALAAGSLLRASH